MYYGNALGTAAAAAFIWPRAYTFMVQKGRWGVWWNQLPHEVGLLQQPVHDDELVAFFCQ